MGMSVIHTVMHSIFLTLRCILCSWLRRWFRLEGVPDNRGDSTIFLCYYEVSSSMFSSTERAQIQ